MSRRFAIGIVLACGWLAACCGAPAAAEPEATSSASLASRRVDRSPVDLQLSPDGQWLVTANQTSDSLSLVRIASDAVVDEVACGQRPEGLAVSPDGQHVLATASLSGELLRFEIRGERLIRTGSVQLGYEPQGVAVSADGRRAYVALYAAAEVAVVDLPALTLRSKIAVGRWPRYLALSSDGTRLAVGCSGEGGITVVDTQAEQRLYDSKFLGLNIGHLQVSADGLYAYFPWVVYADRPITPGNIRQGWVLANRLARVRLDGKTRREAMALDPRGHGVADPHGLALSPDEQWVALTASGTGELVLLRLRDLPLSPEGTGDHLKIEPTEHDERFIRIPLGGRPLGLRYNRAGTEIFVTNYLTNSVQVVDVARRTVARTISLGPSGGPALARQGEAIFYDAHRSTDGWYSCHTCHYQGDTNALTMDTRNDDSWGTFKMVLSLRNVKHTGPWFWHGLQDDLPAALRKSLVGTMQGPEPTDDDVAALGAFLASLPQPANSRRAADGSFSPAAERGRQLFVGAEAACATCHSGPYLTDGLVHDVGLGTEYDVHKGYNTPSLIGVGNRINWLHHGRAKTLEQLLTELHGPAKVLGTRPLTKQEVADLAEYLRAL